MRELVFSVGLTFLTGTLLFVYFRNKFNAIDKKVNMVFNTIQQHNKRMQNEAEEEMRRFSDFQQRQEQMMNHDPLPKEEDIKNENLIDVSDNETNTLESKNLDNFDTEEESDNDSDEDSSDEESEDEKEENKVIGEKEKNDDDIQELTVENLEELNILNVSLDSVFDYKKLTKVELKKLCEKKDLIGYKSLNKGMLIELLQSSDH